MARIRRPTILPIAIATSVLTALLSAVAGCSSHPFRKGSNVQTVDLAVATQAVQRYADQTLGVIGNPTLVPGDGMPNPNPQPCDGQSKHAYNMIGIWGFDVAPGRALNTLDKLRAHWKQAGYTITEDRRFSDPPSGDLSATNPADHYGFSLAAGDTETRFVLTIASPCFHSDAYE